MIITGVRNVCRAVAPRPRDGDVARAPIEWSADRVIVAGSGDLGVTIGMIRPNAPSATRRAIPFFTIWRRDGAARPWRYIAE